MLMGQVRKVQSEIDDVKQVMVQNIWFTPSCHVTPTQVMVQNVERLLERGEKIELLVSLNL